MQDILFVSFKLIAKIINSPVVVFVIFPLPSTLLHSLTLYRTRNLHAALFSHHMRIEIAVILFRAIFAKELLLLIVFSILRVQRHHDFAFIVKFAKVLQLLIFVCSKVIRIILTVAIHAVGQMMAVLLTIVSGIHHWICLLILRLLLLLLMVIVI